MASLVERNDHERRPTTGNRQSGSRRSVLVLVTEDWFVVSHFLPLLRALVALDLDVTVATRCAGKQHLVEATGVRVVPFDYRRGAIDPRRDARVAAGLRRLIRKTSPDAVHAIAMKPILLGALLAAAGLRIPLVIHLTGVGLAGISPGLATRAIYNTILTLIRVRLRSPRNRVLIENTDDRARLARPHEAANARIALLGGAGIDPGLFAMLEAPPPEPVRIAFVGRMVWSKGVDVLVEAHRRLREEGLPLELILCGAPDPENPRAIDAATLEGWSHMPGVRWTGFEADVRRIWREAHIAAVPSRGGEGLPKALLEAAACGRPLVVTDVAGCRHFVRDGVEGLIVPPDDAAALAGALRKLATDRQARQRMGIAARARVLSGFTEADVQAVIQGVYRDLLHIGPAAAVCDRAADLDH